MIYYFSNIVTLLLIPSDFMTSVDVLVFARGRSCGLLGPAVSKFVTLLLNQLVWFEEVFMMHFYIFMLPMLSISDLKLIGEFDFRFLFCSVRLMQCVIWSSV